VYIRRGEEVEESWRWMRRYIGALAPTWGVKRAIGRSQQAVVWRGGVQYPWNEPLYLRGVGFD
jgi:hypothetical protein